MGEFCADEGRGRGEDGRVVGGVGGDCGGERGRRVGGERGEVER